MITLPVSSPAIISKCKCDKKKIEACSLITITSSINSHSLTTTTLSITARQHVEMLLFNFRLQNIFSELGCKVIKVANTSITTLETPINKPKL
ncbi:unnamed protein product [Rotaria sordida]|uniref:Uncharacterized protein n=1 Tax=Rotaria sordida TaxID=392033 RepID=A0A819FHL2_9BILA|nr:unnamed protein product [Rotaria sordida]